MAAALLSSISSVIMMSLLEPAYTFELVISKCILELNFEYKFRLFSSAGR